MLLYLRWIQGGQLLYMTLTLHFMALETDSATFDRRYVINYSL